MNYIEIIPEECSYFHSPISNTIPYSVLTLSEIADKIRSGTLKSVTDKIRSGQSDKKEALPYFTPSGVFTSRNDNDIVSYSAIVGVDLDDVDINLSSLLFNDKFLKPCFVFISPSGNGIKLFVRVKNADASFHKDYFNAVSLWLFKQYKLPCDPSCVNISRACFLCHDPKAFYSDSKFIDSESLLSVIPPKPPEQPEFLSYFKKLYSYFNYEPEFKKHEANKLNYCRAIHDHAVNALLTAGWTQTGIFFTRPGTGHPNSKHATFSVPPNCKIWVFYNFSTKAAPFLPNKGYTDVQVISLLEFDGDYSKCAEYLSFKYDSQILTDWGRDASRNERDASHKERDAINRVSTDPLDNYFNRRDFKTVISEGIQCEERRRIVGSFLYEDTIALLFSRTNYGKSMLALQFGCAAATGTDFDSCEAFKNECEPMKTLMIDLELDHKTIAKRHRLFLDHPHPYASNFIFLHEKLENKVLIGFDLLEKIESLASREKPKLLIIDNISKLLPDAVRPEVATMVITILNRIRYNTGCSILVIGHTTKGNPKCAIQPNDYFGSSMIQNFFSELFYLDKTKDDNFFLCNVKSKDKESYETTVPVLSRGDHSRLGVGFSFCYLSSIADIQLPYFLNNLKSHGRGIF